MSAVRMPCQAAFRQISRKTFRRYNFVAKLDTSIKHCLWWWARFGRRVFYSPGGHRREIHKQKECASLSCFKVPTAG